MAWWYFTWENLPQQTNPKKWGGGAGARFITLDNVKCADRVPLGISYEKKEDKRGEERKGATNLRCIAEALEELELLRTAAIFAVANP